MKRSYYLITFKRGDEIKTITDQHTHPLIFLELEEALEHNTVILFYKELTKEEYEFSKKGYFTE